MYRHAPGYRSALIHNSNSQINTHLALLSFNHTFARQILALCAAGSKAAIHLPDVVQPEVMACIKAFKYRHTPRNKCNIVGSGCYCDNPSYGTDSWATCFNIPTIASNTSL